jgi:hypothetical protein
MKKIYLVLAIAGAILPYLFFAQFIMREGVNLASFVSALFANPAAAGFTTDLLFTSFVFWLMMFVERRRDSTQPSPYLFIALNLLIGLSCAIPAYLYAREKK